MLACLLLWNHSHCYQCQHVCYCGTTPTAINASMSAIVEPPPLLSIPACLLLRNHPHCYHCQHDHFCSSSDVSHNCRSQAAPFYLPQTSLYITQGLLARKITTTITVIITNTTSTTLSLPSLSPLLPQALPRPPPLQQSYLSQVSPDVRQASLSWASRMASMHSTVQGPKGRQLVVMLW